LKVLEKSLNLNLQYVEILHLITVLKQTLVCISPVLVVSSLDYLTNSHCLYHSLQYWWVQYSTRQCHIAV